MRSTLWPATIVAMHGHMERPIEMFCLLGFKKGSECILPVASPAVFSDTFIFTSTGATHTEFNLYCVSPSVPN